MQNKNVLSIPVSFEEFFAKAKHVYFRETLNFIQNIFHR